MNTTPVPEWRSPSRWRYGVCFMLLLATTLNYMDRITLNQTAARIQIAFALNNEQYGWLESAFSFAFALGTLSVGWLVDRTGVRWVYPIIVFGWSLAGFLTGYAQSYAMLLLFRIMLGFFEAGNWPCGIRTTRQVMPPEERSLGNAIFQSDTALGAVITPFIVLACILWADPADGIRLQHGSIAGAALVYEVYPPVPNAWQVPFRIVGAIGILWVIAWVVLVRSSVLQPVDQGTTAAQDAKPFWTIFRDRRFWILVVVIVGVNMVWHTFRVWLPLFLQKERGFTEREMTSFVTMYYLTADVGSWTVGLMVLLMARRGYGLFFSRMVMFVTCMLLVICALAVPFLERGPWMTAAILATGFGGLGLFATYFTLSQEVSAKHQGKVTGTLGCLNGIILGIVFPLQGKLKDGGISFGWIFATAWVPAAVAVVVVLAFWPREAKAK